MNNKKGFVLSLAMFAILIVVIVLFLALFFILPTVRYQILGVALMFGAIYAVTKITNTKTRMFVFATLGILGLGMVLFSSSLPQTFLGISQMNTDDGKGYWLITATADGIGEGIDLLVKLPTQGVLPDGTKVIPQKALRLTISKGEANCEYLLYQKTASIWTGVFTKTNVVYYDVGSPDRVIEAIFSDDRANSYTIDGTVSQSFTFTDSDGKGTAVIKTVKSTQGKEDCVSPSNLAILKASENTKLSTDYPIEYLDRTQLLYWLNERQTWLGSLATDVKAVPNNVEFTGKYDSLTILNNKLTGTGRDIGDVIYTVTADRDYFNSVIIVPEKASIPKVSNIDYPAELGVGKTSTIKVNIVNDGPYGTANIKLSSTYASFSPSTGSFTLRDSYTYTAQMTATSTIKDNAPITVKVCGVSQVASTTCDTEIIYMDITQTAVEKCGDNICQTYETSGTCPQDCEDTIECELPYVEQNGECVIPSECSWFQTLKTKETKDYGLLYWRAIFGNPIVTPVTYCGTADWVYLAVGAGIITILGVTYIIVFKPKLKAIKSKRRKK